MSRRRPTTDLSALPFGRETAEVFQGRISIIDVAAGDRLCRQGRYRPELVWLLQGEADVVRNGQVIAHVVAPTVLGEINATRRKPYQTADVVTTTPAVVGVQNLSEWRTVAADSPVVADYVARLAETRLAGQADRAA